MRVDTVRWLHRITRAALGAVALLLVACAADAPQDALRPAGDNAQSADQLWTLVFWLAVAVFVVVEGLLVYALFRFRRRRGAAPGSPRQVHGNTRMEIAWTIAPAVLLAFVAAPTVATIFELSSEPDDSLRVTVVAKQFWWEYEYQDSGVITANELHIPVGRPVALDLEGTDVIHSFWVPRLAGKQDVVPGRRNFLWLSADEPGRYLGQCAEFCGLSHANMRIRVFAHPPGEFEQWLRDQAGNATEPTEPDAIEGKRIFEESQCVACHTVRGTPAEGRIGPDLTHFATRTSFGGAMFERTDEELRAWIRDAPGVKPGTLMPTGADMGLDDDDIDKLVAYLQSLR